MTEAPHVTNDAPAHLVEDLQSALDTAPLSGEIRRRDVPRALLVRPTIGALVRDAVVDWLWLACLWLTMSQMPAWSYPVWGLLVAGRLHAHGVTLHDATHMPLRHKGPWTHVLEVLAGYPLATTLNAMRYHHIRHHRDSGMPTDPYYKAGVDERPVMWLLQWLRGLLLMPFWSLRPVFGLVALMRPGLLPTYAKVFLQDRSGTDLRQSREVRDCARAEFGQLVWLCAVIALWWSWPTPVLLGYVLPAWLAGLLASYRLLQEHAYQPTHDRTVATLLRTTHDHNLGLLDRVCMAPKNIGYHITHHLHPQVSWRALPALRRWYKNRYPDSYPKTRRWWGGRP
ncbi:MAG: fatty acid desaturase [Myxococcales bacterium]|nr:fatty acid desaturase [Myxococcales bacterium]